MTELKHLQKVILSIAKDIDVLCRKNGIDYYLEGGSAIGAIRHKGFIPWDDDFDIIMDSNNYEKFISVCRVQLDKEKYALQVGLEDWPLYFSKIRLRGTDLKEKEGYVLNDDMRGIYVDVFKMDNVSGNPIVARWQYVCAKYHLCYQLSQRTYNSATLKKKILMFLSLPLRIKCFRNFILRQTTLLNNRETLRYGFYYSVRKWKNGIFDKKIFGKPVYVPFEDTMFPIAEKYHEFLTQEFGDYMKLPPIEQQKGLHLINVEFGKY